MTILLPWRWSTGRSTLPWSHISRSFSISSIALSAFPSNLPCRIHAFSTTKLVHQFLVVVFDGITSTTAWRAAIVTPILATCAVWAVASHMASITTDSANDVGGEVACLWTIVLAMADLAAILTSLVFIVTQSAVECSQFAELITLEFVLAFGNGGGLHICQ